MVHRQAYPSRPAESKIFLATLRFPQYRPMSAPPHIRGLENKLQAKRKNRFREGCIRSKHECHQGSPLPLNMYQASPLQNMIKDCSSVGLAYELSIMHHPARSRTTQTHFRTQRSKVSTARPTKAIPPLKGIFAQNELNWWWYSKE